MQSLDALTEGKYSIEQGSHVSASFCKEFDALPKGEVYRVATLIGWKNFVK